MQAEEATMGNTVKHMTAHRSGPVSGAQPAEATPRSTPKSCAASANSAPGSEPKATSATHMQVYQRTQPKTFANEVYKCFLCKDMGWVYATDRNGELIWERESAKTGSLQN
jgi:hypothetical protein